MGYYDTEPTSDILDKKNLAKLSRSICLLIVVGALMTVLWFIWIFL